MKREGAGGGTAASCPRSTSTHRAAASTGSCSLPIPVPVEWGMRGVGAVGRCLLDVAGGPVVVDDAECLFASAKMAVLKGKKEGEKKRKKKKKRWFLHISWLHLFDSTRFCCRVVELGTWSSQCCNFQCSQMSGEGGGDGGGPTHSEHSKRCKKLIGASSNCCSRQCGGRGMLCNVWRARLQLSGCSAGCWWHGHRAARSGSLLPMWMRAQ